MSAISKLGGAVNGVSDAVSQFDPIGGAIMKATNPFNLFGGDSMQKNGGTSSVPGSPAMPGGAMDIDALLAKLSGGKNGQDTSSVANVSTNLGRGGTDAGTDGTDANSSASGAGGAGGLGNIMQSLMGIVGKILPMLMSFL